MFYAQMFVHDKHLVQFMHAISGLALDLKILPATNAKESGNGSGTVKPVANARNLTDLVAVWLQDKHGQTIHARDIGAWLKSIGRSPASKTYLAAQATKIGLLKKIGEGPLTNYLVLDTGAPVSQPKLKVRKKKKTAAKKKKARPKKKAKKPPAPTLAFRPAEAA
jgi:hypothetical protein